MYLTCRAECFTIFSMPERENRQIDLALAGGGAKGLVYAGFIQALIENDIEVNRIVGTSAGAVVGFLHSHFKKEGIPFSEFQSYMNDLGFWKMLKPKFYNGKFCVFDPQICKEIFSKIFPEDLTLKGLSENSVPVVVLFGKDTGGKLEPYYLENSDDRVLDLVPGAMSYTFLFPPYITKENIRLIDGAHLPRRILGVDYIQKNSSNLPSVGVYTKPHKLLSGRRKYKDDNLLDGVFCIHAVGSRALFNRLEENVDIGYQFGLSAIGEIEELLIR